MKIVSPNSNGQFRRNGNMNLLKKSFSLGKDNASTGIPKSFASEILKLKTTMVETQTNLGLNSNQLGLKLKSTWVEIKTNLS